MDAPRRGNEHIARGRAKRHPGNQTPTLRALQGQKHKNTRDVKKCKYLIINAFALSGRMYESYYSRGAASLCPGLWACCPVGARSGLIL